MALNCRLQVEQDNVMVTICTYRYRTVSCGRLQLPTNIFISIIIVIG